MALLLQGYVDGGLGGKVGLQADTQYSSNWQYGSDYSCCLRDVLCHLNHMRTSPQYSEEQKGKTGKFCETSFLFVIFEVLYGEVLYLLLARR